MTRAVVRCLLCTAVLLAAAVSGWAQRGGGRGGIGGGFPQRGGQPPFGGNPGFPGGNSTTTFPGANRTPPRSGTGSASTNSGMRGGLQLGPPGRFWDDKGFAKSLNLRKDQQKKMDSIFDANRATLMENYRTLQVEEKRLEKVTKERPLDESRIFAGIDAVVQARGNLEKANAHMLLMIRREMDSDQGVRMDKFRDEPVLTDTPKESLP